MTNQQKQALITALVDGHFQAAVNNRNSISTATFLNAYAGSGNVIQSLSAALLTTGSMHAPLEITRDTIQTYHKYNTLGIRVHSRYDTLRYMVTVNHKIRYPGVGNAFFKDGVDPSFKKIYDLIADWSSLPYEYVDACNKATGKHLYLNAAGITAIVCILIDAPPLAEINYFLQGRAAGWLSLIS